MRVAVNRPTVQHARCRISSRRARGVARRAFTFVELVIVILIMGIFTAVAVPSFVDSLMFHRVESAARRFKADLELARQTARLTSSTQMVTVIVDTYDITAVTDLNRPSQAYRVDLSKPPYEVKVIANFLRDNGDNRTDVSFNGYGIPNSKGTISLLADGHQCDLLLDRTTGEVTIDPKYSRGRTAATSGD